MSLSSSSRNLRTAFVPGLLVQRCITQLQFDASHTPLLTRSLNVTSQFRASINKMMFWWVIQIHTECGPDEPDMTHYLGWRVQNLENLNFPSGLLSLNVTNNSWRLHRTNGFCLWTPSVWLHNPFSSEAVCCINHPQRKHEQDQLSLGQFPYLFWKVVQVSPLFALVLSQIELNTLTLWKYSEQYFRDQESGTKVNIYNFLVFEVVTSFSFIAACSLSKSSALFLVSLPYIGDGFPVSICKTLYTIEMFSLYTFKTSFNLSFAFEVQISWETSWILTGETPMFLRVKFLFWSFMQQKIIIWC